MAVHDGGRAPIHHLLGLGNGPQPETQVQYSFARDYYCRNCLEGRCSRGMCKTAELWSPVRDAFTTPPSPSPPPTTEVQSAGAGAATFPAPTVWSNFNGNAATQEDTPPQSQPTPKVKPCKYFLNGTDCVFGDSCTYLHSWSSAADDVRFIKKLEGNRKPIKGIALPSCSNKLFTGNIDTLKIWDCSSGECIGTVEPGCRIGCVVGAETWVLLGVIGAVKVKNTQTGVDQSLEFPGGRQVYALALGNVKGVKFLFAGLSDGNILVWRWNGGGKAFQPAIRVTSCLSGAHGLAIRSLVVWGERLYSGSMDCTVRVWDLASLRCIQTLSGHSDSVTSIVCWGSFLLSGSLDKTVRIWGSSQQDPSQLDLKFTHKEDGRVLALCGMVDARCGPVLLCSCDNYTVYLYDLPSFVEKGRIFSGDEVGHIVAGPEGLFFTGNASGELKVWKWRTGSEN